MNEEFRRLGSRCTGLLTFTFSGISLTPLEGVPGVLQDQSPACAGSFLGSTLAWQPENYKAGW